MKLYIFDGGHAHLPDMNHLTPDRNVGKPVTIPLLMFLIDHPKGLVVFDTGVDTDKPGDPYLEASPEQRLDRQMRAAGIPAGRRQVRHPLPSPSGSRRVHGLCSRMRPSSSGARNCGRRGGPTPTSGVTTSTRSCGPAVSKYLQPGAEEALDVFEDGTLVCIDTKGHTEGHQSLVVEPARSSGRIVLAGDAAQVAENFTDKVPPGLCWSSQFAVESIQKLQHMQAQGALVILGHELSALDSLKLAPDCYE